MNTALKQSSGLMLLAALIIGCGSDDKSTSTSVVTQCQAAPGIDRSKPDNIYTANGDGTVSDSQTGLTWDICSLGQTWQETAGNVLECNGTPGGFTWLDAQEQAQTANDTAHLGHSDWRIPNITELGSLVDNGCAGIATNTTFFPGTLPQVYASSSPKAGSNNQVWGVSFFNGSRASHIMTKVFRVRLVRDSQ